MTDNVRYLISGKKREEESPDLYQVIFEQNPSGIYLASLPDGILENCNEAFARAFGYESPLELLGCKLSDFFADSLSYENFLRRMTSEHRLKGAGQERVYLLFDACGRDRWRCQRCARTTAPYE